jgi:hypothetical protein
MKFLPETSTITTTVLQTIVQRLSLIQPTTSTGTVVPPTTQSSHTASCIADCGTFGDCDHKTFLEEKT